MKLAVKFAIAFFLAIAMVLSIDALITLRRERELFTSDMRHDARLLGEALTGPLRAAWKTAGESGVLELIQQANKSEHAMRLRWVWLDASFDQASTPRVRGQDPAALGNIKNVAHFEQDENGIGHLYTYVPIVTEGEHRGALELSESFAERDRYVRTTQWKIILLTMASIAVSTASALVLGAWFVGRPVRSLEAVTRRIASGDLSAKAHIRQHDEFGRLAQDVNAMSDGLVQARSQLLAESTARLQALEQLRHADKLRTVGQLTAGIAHELGTPLNVIMGRAKMIAAGEVDGADARESAQILVGQSERVTKVIRQLLDFARPRTPVKGPVDLVHAVRQTSELLEPSARKRGVTLDFSKSPASCTVTADADQLQQVLSNLIVNAIQAMPHGGTVTIAIDTRSVTPSDDTSLPKKEFVLISVRDSGTGISKENLDKVFEPFFTTKEVGEGTGLGLAVAVGIVKEHGGWIDVRSEEGQGSCFTVYLPRS